MLTLKHYEAQYLNQYSNWHWTGQPGFNSQQEVLFILTHPERFQAHRYSWSIGIKGSFHKEESWSAEMSTHLNSQCHNQEHIKFYFIYLHLFIIIFNYYDTALNKSEYRV
jgi:hypothetical protein